MPSKTLVGCGGGRTATAHLGYLKVPIAQNTACFPAWSGSGTMTLLTIRKSVIISQGNPMTTQTAVSTWSIDATHSIAEFAVKHMMVSTVKGRFGTLEGTISIDE